MAFHFHNLKNSTAHLDVQDLRVGLELGLGEKERLVGTAICMEGEKHCFPVTLLLLFPPPPPLVGEGEGEGEVRGEGNGPTPIVRGSIGSQVFFDGLLSFVSLYKQDKEQSVPVL
jgi:hypothetical protein